MGKSKRVGATGETVQSKRTTTPERKPLSTGDHPLGQASDWMSPGDTPEEPFSPPHRTKGLSPLKGPPIVETVEAYEESDEEPGMEEAKLSDMDEALTDDSKSSYASASSEFGPPNLQDLVHMTHSKCRIACRVTIKTDDKVDAYCGKAVKDCKVHATQRISGVYRLAPCYLKSVTARHGFQGHGLASGPHYTEADMKGFLKDETAESERVVNAINAN